jgi:predicted enzyme related to lactoylglutathione lyase
MDSNPVMWFEIYVQEMARARKFYETVFRITLHKSDNPSPEMWLFPMGASGHGAAGALVHMEGVPSGGNSTLVYFRCEECAAAEARVAEAGGIVQRPKMSIGKYGFISLVVDTEGNMFGLHSMK